MNKPFRCGDGGAKRNRPVTILYFGTFEDYPRNRIMMNLLGKMGHAVSVCHVPLWAGRTDKTGVFKLGGGRLMLIFRLLAAYPRLILKYLLAGRHDIVFVGYPGHLDVLLAKFLGVVTGRRQKIVFDAFISLHDTIVGDRRMLGPGSRLAGCIFQLDKIACRLADVILLDTDAHIDFFRKTFGIPGEKFFKVLASADTSVFYPRPPRKRSDGFRVLFMGKYTPLHGIEHIVEAARLLRDEREIRFTFIGRGQLYEPIRVLVREKGLQNIDFVPWVAYESLPGYIERSDICLGIFSTSAKAKRVIPNKVFQAMAMGKPVISGDTGAARESLTHMEDVFLCEPGNPSALSGAILTLKSDEDLRNRIAAKALGTFEATLGEAAAIAVLEKIGIPHERSR